MELAIIESDKGAIMIRKQKTTSYFIATLVFWIGLIVGSTAQAQPIVLMSGNVSYIHTSNTAVLAVDRIDNKSVAQGITSNLRLELWALPVPFGGLNQAGYAERGHLMASYDLGTLSQDFYFLSVNSGSVPFTPPPAGTWTIAMLLTDRNGGFHNAEGFLPTDFRNLAVEVFSTPAPTTPQVGLWWNPNESGTGYNIDYRNGTLVVTVFSYKANGDPQWYLASGPLNGTRFIGTLDKYMAGQCISCVYAGRPTLDGNDGVITIDFLSSTSAAVVLPGGRVTKIQPQLF
jgi:hypothetical protein